MGESHTWFDEKVMETRHHRGSISAIALHYTFSVGLSTNICVQKEFFSVLTNFLEDEIWLIFRRFGSCPCRFLILPHKFVYTSLIVGTGWTRNLNVWVAMFRFSEKGRF